MPHLSPPRRKDAAHNRDALLAAARGELARDPHASLDVIARAAGLTRRAVYGHFADRDALVREAIELGAARFNEIAEQTPLVDPVLALATLAARLWDEAVQVRLTAAVALDDTHVEATARSLTPLRVRVRQLVEAGVAADDFRRDIPAGILAELIEDTARMVLRDLDPARVENTRDTVVRVVLSVAGLSWSDVDAVLHAHPEILEENR